MINPRTHHIKAHNSSKAADFLKLHNKIVSVFNPRRLNICSLMTLFSQIAQIIEDEKIDIVRSADHSRSLRFVNYFAEAQDSREKSWLGQFQNALKPECLIQNGRSVREHSSW